jgi:hypothetical protein
MSEPKRGCCFAGHFDFGEHRRLPSHSGEESGFGVRYNNRVMTSFGIGFGIGLRVNRGNGAPEPGDEQVLLLEDSEDLLLEDDEVILLEKQEE